MVDRDGPGPYDQNSSGYVVTVNGTTLDLYAFDPAEPRMPMAKDPWMDCSLIPAAEVNRLLAATGSDRRIALFWPGSQDGFSVLAPQSVFHKLACHHEAAAGSWGLIIP
jgi:hypothetical protein